jgi:hypothetical protein
MKTFLRVWQACDLKSIEQHLFVLGELSGECYRCHAIGLELGDGECPECHVKFKYVGFRRKITLHYVTKFKEQHPTLECIDFDDFKKALSKKEARKLLDI